MHKDDLPALFIAAILAVLAVAWTLSTHLLGPTP